MVQSNTLTITVSQLTPQISGTLQAVTGGYNAVLSGTGFTPNGAVQFYAGATALQSVTATSSGAVSYTFGISSSGTYTFSAADNTSGAKSNSISLNAAEASSAATIAASSSSVNVGQPDTISGMVTDQFGKALASWTVTLTDSTTGATMSTTTNPSGQYSFSVSFTAAGTYNLYVTA